MKALRTLDERFAGLPDFPFEPHYEEIPDGEGGELRVHYLDGGPRAGQIELVTATYSSCVRASIG